MHEKIGSPVCPVSALRRLQSMSGPDPPNPAQHVFRLPLGQSADGPWRNMTKLDLNPWFKKRISDMGLDPDRYMLHGFRHGAVSLALCEEPNINLVKVHSDHTSNSIWAYAQIDVSRRVSVAAAMLEEVHRVCT